MDTTTSRADHADNGVRGPGRGGLVRRAALVAATAALTAVAGAAGAAGAAGTSAGGTDAAGTRGATGAETRQIASSVLGQDYKVTLTALRSTADPYAASVRMRAFTWQDGAWRESDRVTVGEADGWFWFPLTGGHAVCAFSTSGGEPAPVSVSLLRTPSLGCSESEHFELRDGRFHRP
ncbi:hypothetical protein [Streptomyces sp. Z26]|uniref:hypothetical protein n=1 Tax=Streptomyces sp. Z26 TaxID=2500177 RepID=UPI001F0BADD6|nr:hypothetical protein [Streptomyces sp. Z26]